MSFGTGPGNVNRGTDQTIQITCNNPNIAPLGIIYMDGRREEFSSKENSKAEMSEPCDNAGIKDIVRITGEITGTFKLARQNAAFSSVVAALDRAYEQGQPDTVFTIVSTEPAVDGSGVTNIFQYNGVRF